MTEKPTREADKQYPKKEAERRFAATLRAALNTPLKPLKDIPKKRATTQRQKSGGKTVSADTHK